MATVCAIDCVTSLHPMYRMQHAAMFGCDGLQKLQSFLRDEDIHEAKMLQPMTEFGGIT